MNGPQLWPQQHPNSQGMVLTALVLMALGFGYQTYPQETLLRQAVVAHACTPSTQEAEVRWLW